MLAVVRESTIFDGSILVAHSAGDIHTVHCNYIVLYSQMH